MVGTAFVGEERRGEERWYGMTWCDEDAIDDVLVGCLPLTQNTELEL